MNTRQLKSLMKEAMREVIKEELSEILKEAILKNSKTEQLFESNNTEGRQFNFNTNDIITKRSENPRIKNMLDGMYGFNDKTVSKTKNVPELVPITEENKNPFLKFFAQTAAEMTPQDKAALRNLSNE